MDLCLQLSDHEHKILNTSLKANRDNPVFKNFGHPDGKWLMRLLVDREAEKLKLKVSYTDGTEFDERVYWDFCCLKKRFEEKPYCIDHCAVAYVIPGKEEAEKQPNVQRV